MIIRDYKDEDEKGWVYCRVLSFLDCSYFDDVLRAKEKYKNPSICIVAEEDNKIVGILDVEYEKNIGDVCYLKGGLGATIWHLGVLPEYRNKAVAAKMLKYAENKLINNNITRIEVWTQDDEKANNWYVKNKFILKEAYLNAFIRGTVDDEIIKKYINLDNMGDIFGIRSFNFEAPIERKEELEKICYRLHEVRVYEKQLIE